jgi:glycosyltransferase involved in cell wall biosynthesis
VVWSARPGSAALRRLFPDARFVVQVVDYYPAFRGEAVRKVERADYAAADHVFVIGHAMTDYLVHDLGVPRSKIAVLGQGVELERFHPHLSEPPELATLPRPRALWVGVCSKGDPELFKAAAEQLGAVGGSLILAGPKARWVDELTASSRNTVALGAVDQELAAALMVHSDLGLMLYDRARSLVYRGQNPLKLYEYAAAGLAIVSTLHDEFRFIDPPVIKVSDPADLPAAFERAAADRESLAKAALQFARGHTWTRCVARARDTLFGEAS